MNRTKKRAIWAGCVLASAVLIVTAVIYNPFGSSLRSPRRFHIINLSLSRTGTRSIAGLFDRFRSEHEYMLMETNRHIHAWRAKRITDDEMDEFLLERDRRSQLEVDSTSVLHQAQDRLFPLFPDAKYLLVVRNGADWLVSVIDMSNSIAETCAEHDTFLNMPCGELVRYLPVKPEAFRDLNQLGKHVDPMLPVLATFWGHSTLKTLDNLRNLPPDRVLIIRTENIDYSLDKLAAFAGVEKSELNFEKHHLNPDRKRHDFANLIGKEKIAEAFVPWQAKVDSRMRELGVQ